MYENIHTQRVSAINHEAQEFPGSDYDANDLYKVEKNIIGETKENLTEVNVSLITKIKIQMRLKIEIL